MLAQFVANHCVEKVLYQHTPPNTTVEDSTTVVIAHTATQLYKPVHSREMIHIMDGSIMNDSLASIYMQSIRSL